MYVIRKCACNMCTCTLILYLVSTISHARVSQVVRGIAQHFTNGISDIIKLFTSSFSLNVYTQNFLSNLVHVYVI